MMEHIISHVWIRFIILVTQNQPIIDYATELVKNHENNAKILNFRKNESVSRRTD